MKFLITGGCGFLGSNLAFEVLKRKHNLVVLDNLSRQGSEKNLESLQTSGTFSFLPQDIRNFSELKEIIRHHRPDAIFHTAGQVAMTTSLNNPMADFEINALGTLNLLEAVRLYSPQSSVFFSSTNKVYGDLEHLTYTETNTRYENTDWPQGFSENLPLDPTTPYGCSKATADLYMREYAKTYGLNTITFRHSSLFGSGQFPTIDQGWIGWFIQQAIQTKKNPDRDGFTISGNGKQVRDVLFVDDAVNCYFSALDKVNEIRSDVFNIGGGSENSFSILELLKILEKELAIKLNYRQIPPRISDQKIFVADISKSKKMFGWAPQISKEEGVGRILSWANISP